MKNTLTTIFGTGTVTMALFEFVKDQVAIHMDEIPHYIFRVLRDDENINEGIIAKNPYATNTPEAHIIHETDNTQWISACACFICAVAWALKDHCRIAVIDTTKVDSLTLNFREGNGLSGRACNFAKSSQEILIHKQIPANAIAFMFGAETISSFLEVAPDFISANSRIDFAHKTKIDEKKDMRGCVSTAEFLLQTRDWINSPTEHCNIMYNIQKFWSMEAIAHIAVIQQ